MQFIVILLYDRQALLVGIESTVNVGVVELERLYIRPFRFGCVDVGHLVVAVPIAEETDA
jgi:hypothetical protein